MRIAVVGAGAVGATYGSLLARSGQDVILIDTAPAQVESIRRKGVTLERPGGARERVSVAISSNADEIADATAVLVLVKTMANPAVARALEPVLSEDAIVVTLQNGVGNDRRLAEVLGSPRIVQGSTTVGAELVAPGHVRASAGALDGRSLTSLQRPADPNSERRVRELAEALEAARLPAEVVDDVGAVVWRKLAMASIGPVCAVLNTTVAEVMDNPSAREVLTSLFDETLAVAAAEGVTLARDELWKHAAETFATIGPHSPSLAIDLAAGRPTEIEAQSGEVQRRGAAHGVPTPATDVVTALIRAIAHRKEQ